MKWPLVSRRAYDLLMDERDRLREQVDKLLDHIKRTDRVEHGMGEVPRPQKPPLEPMPDILADYFAGFADRNIARDSRNAALRRHNRGEAWASIVVDLMEESDA